MNRKTLFIKYISMLALIPVIMSCDRGTMESASVFYIDNQEAFDQYKAAQFSPGSLILFAAGRSFNGQFAPSGSGTKENPIKLTAYDPDTKEVFWENIDNKPMIHGHGEVQAPLYLFNSDHWEVANLEVTNTDGTEDDQGDLMGIYIHAEDSGVMEDVAIRHCYIHEVNGKVAGKRRGGIHIHVTGDKVKTKFHNLLIENNVIKNVGGVGIGNTSSWDDIHSKDYYPWTKFVIRGNRVEHTGRNGIIARVGVDLIVEHNVLAYNSRYSTGHSVFNFNTIGCIMQYNEAYGNTGEPGDIDHGGFDADYNARGTIIQYNYSHDNNWFCGIMRRFNRDVTIRYNISVNERLGAYMYGFPWRDDARAIWIYNNTHFFKAGLNASIFASPGRVRTPRHSYFYNNIFYFEDAGSWGVEPDETCEFSNNLFYNVDPKGDNPITADPNFENPGGVPVDVNMSDPDRLLGYRIAQGSPCIDAGIIIHESGGKDFWGNPLAAGPIDIGAHEKQ